MLTRLDQRRKQAQNPLIIIIICSLWSRPVTTSACLCGARLQSDTCTVSWSVGATPSGRRYERRV